MDYFSSDQAQKYILMNFSLFGLYNLFDLLNFRKGKYQLKNTQIKSLHKLACCNFYFQNLDYVQGQKQNCHVTAF